MAYTPLINATCKITCKDIVNSSSGVAKTFLSVYGINFDYNKAIVTIYDETGVFPFPLKPVTSVAFTVVTGLNGQTSIVIS